MAFIFLIVVLIVGHFAWKILMGVSSLFFENDNLAHGVTIELKVWPDSPLRHYTTHSKSVLNGTCRNATFVRVASFSSMNKQPPRNSRGELLVDPNTYDRSYECVASYEATKWDQITMSPIPDMLVNGEKVKKTEIYGGDYFCSLEKDWYTILRSLIIGVIVIGVIVVFVMANRFNVPKPVATEIVKIKHDT